jgi:hypothetical protein
VQGITWLIGTPAPVTKAKLRTVLEEAGRLRLAVLKTNPDAPVPDLIKQMNAGIAAAVALAEALTPGSVHASVSGHVAPGHTGGIDARLNVSVDLALPPPSTDAE